eukprot:136786-Pyramimonas_sp.AAC.1
MADDDAAMLKRMAEEDAELQRRLRDDKAWVAAYDARTGYTGGTQGGGASNSGAQGGAASIPDWVFNLGNEGGMIIRGPGGSQKAVQISPSGHLREAEITPPNADDAGSSAQGGAASNNASQVAANNNSTRAAVDDYIMSQVDANIAANYGPEFAELYNSPEARAYYNSKQAAEQYDSPQVRSSILAPSLVAPQVAEQYNGPQVGWASKRRPPNKKKLPAADPALQLDHASR